MSDDTLFLRGRIEERKDAPSKVGFTRDGFDYWAETEAPARVGQVQKIPAEPTTTTMQGDALRRLYARHSKQRARRSPHMEELEGGYLSIPFVGKIPTNLTEFKEWAPQNKDKVGWAVEKGRKYLPKSAQPYIDQAVEFAKSQGYMGAGGPSVGGRRKAMPRKTASRMHPSMEEMDGGYLSIPFVGKIPTNLTEFKEWAPQNKDKVGWAVEKGRKYLPKSAQPYIDQAVEFAKSQGYMGAGTRKGMPRKTARRAYMPSMEEMEGGYAEGSSEYWQAYEKALDYYRPDEAKRRALKSKSMDEVLRGDGRKGRKPSARNMVVKQVMMERGVSLPEASRIVKAEGLY